MLSFLIFISTFSSAEEECDPAIINTGVQLTEAYTKARDSLQETKALDEALDDQDKAWDTFKEAEAAWKNAWDTYDHARNLPEKLEVDKALTAKNSAWDLLQDNLSSLSDKRAFEEAFSTYALVKKTWLQAEADYIETKGNSLSARDDYNNLRTAYHNQRRAFDNTMDDYKEILDNYEKARDNYNTARNDLPEWQRLYDFTSANAGCEKKIATTHKERQEKLNQTRVYSDSGRVSDSKNTSSTKDTGKSIQ